MKHQVLVVDDRIGEEKRRKGYLRLESEVSSRVPGFDIELDFAESPEEIPVKVRQCRYSAALVDAVLDECWPGFDLDFALSHIDSAIPVALLSSQWDRTNAAQLNRAWEKPNCRTFLHWRDIADEGDGEIQYAVAQFSGMIADTQNLKVLRNIDRNHPIRILHISDLQIGGIDTRRLELEANRSAQRVLEKWNKQSPTFVAFTGDITEHGAPEEYRLAQQWLEYFFARLKLDGLPANRLLLVPGNHDVTIPFSAAARLKLVKNEKTVQHSIKLVTEVQRPDLITHAYTPFRDFLAQASDCPLLRRGADDQSLAWVELRYRHLGVVFYGINTARPASISGLPERSVEAKALAEIGNEIAVVLEDYGEQPPIVIGLAHHCPVSASGDRSVNNPEDFATFFRDDAKTALFLHGHIHEQTVRYSSEDGFRLVRSCASTLTKDASARPADSLRGFNLLELHREAHRVIRLETTSFGWVGDTIKPISEGKWERQADGMFLEEL